MRLLPPNNTKPLKMVILGEGGVGKTTLSMTFINNSFYREARQTIAVEFHSKIFSSNNIPSGKVQIWDLGGQDQFKNMGVFREFCRGSDVALLCFDLTDLSSLFSIPDWLAFIEPLVPRFLIGTKSDIASSEEREIDLSAFEKKFQCISSFKCSSKDVLSVIEIFETIVEFVQNYSQNKKLFSPDSSLKISKHLLIS
ncbi:MAG: Rab family GTPase [Candidatus Thorarchaeota archaeon]